MLRINSEVDGLVQAKGREVADLDSNISAKRQVLAELEDKLSSKRAGSPFCSQWMIFSKAARIAAS